MSVLLDEPLSPELVLVSPPALAERARLALPDYERQFDEWLAEARAAFEAAAQAEEIERKRLEAGAVVFTVLMALNSIAALVIIALLLG